MNRKMIPLVVLVATSFSADASVHGKSSEALINELHESKEISESHDEKELRDITIRESQALYLDALNLIKTKNDFWSLVKAREILKVLSVREFFPAMPVLHYLSILVHRTASFYKYDQAKSGQNGLRLSLTFKQETRAGTILDELLQRLEQACEASVGRTELEHEQLICSAQKGDAKAMLTLGDEFLTHDSANEESVYCAIYYYNESRKQGAVAAHLRLGELYEYGCDAFPQRYHAAISNYSSASRVSNLARIGLARLTGKSKLELQSQKSSSLNRLGRYNPDDK